ncbi:peptidoglycan editing factor PgeF [Sulfobacillus sp. DSM 109850]|uniref:Purine nucleoside phosphorylase n=2 Tax=Sulfobacillus harzensis TaxID=2729629 RepID=A0A7Y0L3C0_9FIRM|nr:peptidoglycan editing factor PgeF [Sulfobacillus harzensis]
MVEFRLEGNRVVFDVHPRVQAWFSTRRGGVSLPPFDTLNLSFGVGDLKAAVTENRRRMAAWGGRELDQLVMPAQVHGNHIEWVTRLHAGRGARGAHPIPDTDGFLTEDPEVLLGLGFADCTPIFVADVNARVVGLWHAGWRGTVKGIQRVGVEMLAQRGIPPEDLLIGLGPAIGPCCYEVDEPVVREVRRVADDAVLEPVDASHSRLDVRALNRRLLEQAGVRPEHIAEAPFCTGCRSDLFFSYRVQGRLTGRMGGYICLKP